MDPIKFARALIRLSRFKVGIKEACVLFSIGDGATAAQIAKANSVHPNNAKGRIGIVKAKKLVTSKYQPDGCVTYILTELGQSIIDEVLKQKKP